MFRIGTWRPLAIGSERTKSTAAMRENKTDGPNRQNLEKAIKKKWPATDSSGTKNVRRKKNHLRVFFSREMPRGHRPDVEHDRGVVRELRGEMCGVVQGALHRQACRGQGGNGGWIRIKNVPGI